MAGGSGVEQHIITSRVEFWPEMDDEEGRCLCSRKEKKRKKKKREERVKSETVKQ